MLGITRGQAVDAHAEHTTFTSGDEALELTDEQVEKIAQRVAELLGPEVIRDVAWQVVPDMAEVVVRERLHSLEREAEEA